MTSFMTEEDLENRCLELFKEQEYKVINGADLSPGGLNVERDYKEVVLKKRLADAIDRINKHIPKSARENAIKQVLRSEMPNLIEENHRVHRMLVNGIDVSYRKDGRIVHDKVWLIDKNIEKNEFLAVNQFTIIGKDQRRPDIILFINGLPLVVIELKNPADESATVKKAFDQFQTYKERIPELFKYNEILVISDGLDTRAGTINSKWERFTAWKTINGKIQSSLIPQIEVLIKGMLNKSTLIDIIKHFITYEKEGRKIIKKLAAYHQYNATNKAIERTIKAINGDHRCGVIWHTQGSGKSLTMVFYSGKIISALNNPTLVVITDRNDLDDQLYYTFTKNREILRQTPVQAESRSKLKDLLNVASGGIVFTTIQKFFPTESKDKYPTLSERKNIIVIVDEAHRTQYGFSAKINKKGELSYGFAKYLRDALPNASFIGFTGTPIDKSDKSTYRVFGKSIDVYDVEQSVKDKFTVKIYYESRLVRIGLNKKESEMIDKEFDKLTEGEEVYAKERLKTKWARIEKLIGNPQRIRAIAKDIVNHFTKRLEVMDGKGMIVCMSRRICVDLYNEIIKIRPNWHNDDDKKGFIKVVMTGSASDPVEWQQHIRNKKRRRELGNFFKKPDSPIKLVIVRDMWLTGFDVPSLHTMYIDKPMKGHGLMQAIARVNRVYKDKTGGLIVDYIGIAPELKKALLMYTVRDRKQTGIPIKEAVDIMLEKFEIVENLFNGFDYERFFKIKPTKRMNFLLEATEFIINKKDGKERFLKYTTELLKAFSLVVPLPEAMKIKEKVGFFQAVKSVIVKNTEVNGKYKEDLDTAINQILSKSIVSEGVIDILKEMGIKKPDISILSPKFLEEIKNMQQKNLAFETLKRLLNDEIKIISKKNLIKARSFREMLEKVIIKYTNRAMETAEIIEELISLAKRMKKELEEGKKLGLSEEEVAFYDALANNESAVRELGDETLKKLAIELTEKIHKNTTIDWTIRESAQAKLRVMVKRLLKKYKYPPDKRQEAIKIVLEQAKLFANNVVEDEISGYVNDNSPFIRTEEKKSDYL